jgi:predicted GNAT superfamily acetyltransferase
VGTQSDPGTAARGVVVRPATVRDHPAVHALNDASVPHVNALTAEQFAWLAANVDYFRVAEVDGEFAGFVMAIRRGTPYWSGNYAWFTERFADFIYLDRVVVSPTVRRAGVGRALYADLATFAAGRWPRITLEVNIRPPNPGSVAFHESLGFMRVGARTYDDNEVAMFELPISASSVPGPG